MPERVASTSVPASPAPPPSPFAFPPVQSELVRPTTTFSPTGCVSPQPPFAPAAAPNPPRPSPCPSPAPTAPPKATPSPRPFKAPWAPQPKPLPPNRAPLEVQATQIREIAGSAYLRNSSLMAGLFDATAYKLFLDQLLEDCGNPSDPIERMMVEQLALAHHACGHLHVRAAQNLEYEGAVAYSAAASRLMAEFRRSALALKLLRTGASPALRAVGVEDEHDAPAPCDKAAQRSA